MIISVLPEQSEFSVYAQILVQVHYPWLVAKQFNY